MPERITGRRALLNVTLEIFPVRDLLGLSSFRSGDLLSSLRLSNNALSICSLEFSSCATCLMSRSNAEGTPT